MIDERISQLLHNPSSWTHGELIQVQNYFARMRPNISAEVAIALWKYWRQHLPDQLLFPGEEDNVALFLHAQVYDQTAGFENNALQALLKRYEKIYTQALASYPDWDIDAVTHDNLLVGLRSPIVQVFIASEQHIPQQILIIGEGIPEIRERIYPATFMASLRIHGIANDIMNVGILRVEMPGTATTPLSLPFEIVGDRRGRLSPERLPAAEDALRELIALLRQLEQDTGLVRIHDIDISQQKALTDSLRKHAQQLQPNQAQLWISQEARKASERTQPGAELATITPLWQLTDERSILSMTLNADILRTTTYLRLQTAYQDATIERILIDLDTRAEHYRSKREQYMYQQRRYSSATEAERKQIWGNAIITTHEFNPEIGMDLTLPEMQELPVDYYFAINIPWLIKHYQEWQYRVEGIAISLRKVARREDAPVRRFAASRFLDAALRQCTIAEDVGIQREFDLWYRSIASMLWFEWRCLLKKRGIVPSMVFSNHTFLHTLFTLKAENSEFDEIIIAPMSVFDQKRSIALFDQSHHIIQVVDPSDFPQGLSKASMQDALLEQLIGITKTHQREQSKTWQQLTSFAELPTTTLEQFVEQVRIILRQSPSELVNNGISTILEESETFHSKDNLSSEQQELDELLKAACSALSPARRLRRAYSIAILGAYHSARELLSDTTAEPEWLVRQYLVRTLVECRAAGIRYEHMLPRTYPKRLTELPETVRAWLQQAVSLNQAFVQQWIRLLAEASHTTALNRLWHISDTDVDVIEPKQRATLLARGAIEQVKIAQKLQRTINTFNEHSLARDIALFRLASTIEHAFLSKYSEPRLEEINSVIEELTSTELPKLRRTRI